MTTKADHYAARGTRLQGHVDVHYTDLVAAFGPPHYGDSDDGKVQAEWVLHTPFGVATIYDYKSGLLPENNRRWHVGGHSAGVVDFIRDAVEFVQPDPDTQTMTVGFTGTQRGLTADQVVELVEYLRAVKATELHHGDCVGADAQAHRVAVALGLRTVIHPPREEGRRAWCKADEVRPPKEFLDRNHDIVDDCDLLIACPAQAQEVRRSGTWSTWRYAGKANRPTVLITPNTEEPHRV